MMTNQEIFDTVARHLLAQGAKSMQGGTCAYRGDHRRKCAVGALIPDERYHVTLEGWGCSHSSVLNAIGCGLESAPLLRRLQQLHDFLEPDQRPEALVDAAEDYRLTPVDELCAEVERRETEEAPWGNRTSSSGNTRGSRASCAATPP